MATFCRRPKATLAVLNILRHLMTGISIPLTIICAYIVISSRSVTRVYAYMLVLLLIASSCVDIFLQWVFDPSFLVPLICFFRRSPVLNFPISAGACASLMHSIIGGVCGPLYFSLFIYRHQLIIPAGSRFKFSVVSQILFILCLLIPYCSIGVSFYAIVSPISTYERVKLSDDWEESIIQTIDCMLAFELATDVKSIVKIAVYSSLCGCGLIFAFFFITAITWHIFQTLSEAKAFSAKTKDLHRQLTKSVAIQALMPMTFVILPYGAVLLLNVLITNYYPEITNGWAIDPLDFAILVISFHSTAHSVSLLISTPIFRAKLYEVVSFFKKINSVTTTIKPVSFTDENFTSKSNNAPHRPIAKS